MDNTSKNDVAEREIDLLDLGRKLWSKRKFIGIISLIGLVLGLIVAFSIPKEYTTTVILTPESSEGSNGNGVGALAAMAGINLNQSSQDAISPELYPDIVGSTPFIIGLFNVKVKDVKDEIDTDLYTYLSKEQKNAWWGYVLKLPSIIFSSNKEHKDNIPNQSKYLTLSEEGSVILKDLQNRINISVDKKTGAITLTSTMQSPEISASIADTLTFYLQSYIIDYRTQKARQDLIFTEKLYDESKNEYYKAQKNYATFSDENLGIISARYATTKERLQNEMALAYTVYNQTAQQLQMAKMKVQDTTPVYSVIQPSVVPLIPEKPNKKLIVIGFVFLALIGSGFCIIAKDLFFNQNN